MKKVEKQDFLIVCNHLGKLQMIQDILTARTAVLFDSQPRKNRLRPQSFSFSPRLSTEEEMSKMWAAGTEGHNFKGAIFCDFSDDYRLKDTNQIPKLCEEFAAQNPKCIVTFHFDLEIPNVNQIRLKHSNQPNLNVFFSIEPIEIVQDMEKLVYQGRADAFKQRISEIHFRLVIFLRQVLPRLASLIRRRY